jgi:hypothetical protein
VLAIDPQPRFWLVAALLPLPLPLPLPAGRRKAAAGRAALSVAQTMSQATSRPSRFATDPSVLAIV